MAGPTVVIRILADASAATSTLNQTSGKISSGLGKAAAPAALAGGAALAMGKQFADAASETQQAMGAVQSIFGDNAGTVQQWAKSSATSVGLSTSQYAQMASKIGSQLKNMGLPQDQVLDKTKSLVEMGADMAATYGGTTADAVGALSSALRGETDPIERYGVSVKQADVAARMAADGTKKLTGNAGKAAKTNAMLGLVTEQTASAHGQFAREADTAAGVQERSTAQMANASAVIGEALLPVMATLGTMLGKGAEFAKEHAGAVRIVLGMVLGLAAAILILNGALKIYRATQTAISVVTKVWAARQVILNAVMSINPIALIILAIVALVVAIVIAYKKSATFRAIVQGAFKAIAAAASWMWNNVLKPVFAFIVTWAKKLWTAFLTAASFIKRAIVGIGNIAGWLWKNAIKPAISAIVGYFKWWWETAMTAKDKVVAVFKALWTKAVEVKDKIVAAFKTIGEKLTNNAIVEAIKDMIDWFGKLFDKIKNFKLPKWLTDLGGKIGGIINPKAGPTYVPAPAVRGGTAGTRGAAATPAAASSGAGATMNKLTGAGAQVVVQVSDRRMVDLVNVQLRDAATATARSLTRRQVVIV